MLNHLNRDMRYLLLQMKGYTGCNLLYAASCSGHTDIMKVIHGSVTQAQWSNLLRMKAGNGMTALQMTAFCNKHSSIETIRDSVSNDTWKWYSEFHYLTTMIVSTFIETTIIELLV